MVVRPMRAGKREEELRRKLGILRSFRKERRILTLNELAKAFRVSESRAHSFVQQETQRLEGLGLKWTVLHRRKGQAGSRVVILFPSDLVRVVDMTKTHYGGVPRRPALRMLSEIEKREKKKKKRIKLKGPPMSYINELNLRKTGLVETFGLKLKGKHLRIKDKKKFEEAVNVFKTVLKMEGW